MFFVSSRKKTHDTIIFLVKTHKILQLKPWIKLMRLGDNDFCAPLKSVIFHYSLFDCIRICSPYFDEIHNECAEFVVDAR